MAGSVAGFTGLIAWHAVDAGTPVTAGTGGAGAAGRSRPAATARAAPARGMRRTAARVHDAARTDHAVRTATGPGVNFGYGTIAVKVTIHGTRITAVSVAALQTLEPTSQQNLRASHTRAAVRGAVGPERVHQLGERRVLHQRRLCPVAAGRPGHAACLIEHGRRGSALGGAGESGETAFTHAEKVMGTVVSFTVVPGDLPAAAARAAVEAACRVLHRADAVFSTWNLASPVSRLRRGEVTLDRVPAEVSEVLTLCQTAREASEGWFDPWALPGGFDPTGLVKGWAVERAAGVLQRAGIDAALVNGGGDLTVFGSPAPGRRWRVGIRHPWRADALACIVQPRAAVATSADYERGAHLLDPADRAPGGRRRLGHSHGPQPGARRRPGHRGGRRG